MPNFATISGPLTRANSTISSVNAESRTLEVVFATETPVRRYNWHADEYFNEVLAITPEAIRSQRLSSAPFLQNHNQYGLDSVLGVVESFRIENGNAYATIRLAPNPSTQAQVVIRNIQDGILRNISVGYEVHSYERTPPVNPGDTPVYRAIDWEPKEISIVTVPADPNSGTRSDDQSQRQNITLLNMPENAQIPPVGGSGAATSANIATPQPNVISGSGEQSARQESAPVTAQAQNTQSASEPQNGTMQHNERNQIVELVRAVNLPDSFAVGLLARNDINLQTAQTAILSELARNQPQINSHQNPVSVGASGSERFMQDAENAILMRHTAYTNEQLGITPEQARSASELRNVPLSNIARRVLELNGERVDTLDNLRIVRDAISLSVRNGGVGATSSIADFPVLLEGTARRVLIAGFGNTTGLVWDQFCSTGSVRDFRDWTRVRQHQSFNKLEKLNENGEYQTLPINDAETEKVRVETYGGMFNLSRQMLVNDDLDAFVNLMSQFGISAARTIELEVFNVLLSNAGLGPIMSDSKTLFHEDHGNVAAPGAMSVDVFDAMRVQMATQRPYGWVAGKKGVVDDYLSVTPSILLINNSKFGRASILNNSQYDPDATNKTSFLPNRSAGMFQRIVQSPRFAVNPFYFFADPSVEPVIEVSFLNGVREPFVDQQIGFDVDGIRYKMRHDFGVKAVGYKGAIRNAGA